jgi:hypothetical protein
MCTISHGLIKTVITRSTKGWGFEDDWEHICNQDPKTPDFKMTKAWRLKGDVTKGEYRWAEEQRDKRIAELAALILQKTEYRVEALRRDEFTTGGVDTATAMKIVGHMSEKTWKRYNSIEEKDLLQAVSTLNTYLQINTVITPDHFCPPVVCVTA